MSRIVITLAACALLLLAPPDSVSASTISRAVAIEPSELQFRESGASRTEISVEGLPRLEYKDYPALPYRVVSILVPQGEEVSSYRFEVLSSGFVRAPRPLATFAGRYRDDGTVGGLRSRGRKGPRRPRSPRRWCAYLGTNVFRGYRIATFAVYPVRYEAETGTVVVASDARLVVETASAPSGTGEAAQRSALRRGVPGGISRESVPDGHQSRKRPPAYTFDEIKVESGDEGVCAELRAEHGGIARLRT